MTMYVVTGQLSADAMKKISQAGVGRLRGTLNESAKSLNGRLVDLYFVTGDYRIVAMFDFARGDRSAPLSSIVYSALTCGYFEPGARLAGLESAEEIDQAFRAFVPVAPA